MHQAWDTASKVKKSKIKNKIGINIKRDVCSHLPSLMPALPLAHGAPAKEGGEVKRSLYHGSYKADYLQIKETGSQSHSKECSLYWRSDETSSLQAWYCDIRNLLTWFTNFPSSIWYEKLLGTSKQTCVSRVQLWVLCRRQVRLIWVAFLKTPTWELSIPTCNN